MKKYYNYLDADRLSRKDKKNRIGRKLNRNKLRKLLKSIKIIESGDNYHSNEILPYPFCPKCGCTNTYSTGNMAPYPERWVEIFCARCDHFVECSDNSPFYHCLEFAENDYTIY
jgi:hypothetical protein